MGRHIGQPLNEVLHKKTCKPFILIFTLKLIDDGQWTIDNELSIINCQLSIKKGEFTRGSANKKTCKPFLLVYTFLYIFYVASLLGAVFYSFNLFFKSIRSCNILVISTYSSDDLL